MTILTFGKQSWPRGGQKSELVTVKHTVTVTFLTVSQRIFSLTELPKKVLEVLIFLALLPAKSFYFKVFKSILRFRKILQVAVRFEGVIIERV